MYSLVSFPKPRNSTNILRVWWLCLRIFTLGNICSAQATISGKVIYFSNYFPHWLGLLCSPKAWTRVSILILFAASMLRLASKYLIGLRISSVAPGKTKNTLVKMKLESSVLIYLLTSATAKHACFQTLILASVKMAACQGVMLATGKS